MPGGDLGGRRGRGSSMIRNSDDTDEIDRAIKGFREKLRANSVPLRMRDKRAAPNDGYPDYITQAEMDASSMLAAEYRESIMGLKLLKRIITGDSI